MSVDSVASELMGRVVEHLEAAIMSVVEFDSINDSIDEVKVILERALGDVLTVGHRDQLLEAWWQDAGQS